MADISLGQTINGSLTSDDSKYSGSGYSFDRYEFTGLDDYRQLTITVTRPLFAGFEVILRNATTGEIVDFALDDYGAGKLSLNATTFPGIKYQVEVNGGGDGFFGTVKGNDLGSYTLSTVDGGKATSIVSTSGVQIRRGFETVGVGTVGADGKFFSLASGTGLITDVALSPNGQFYGISSNILLRIDPRKNEREQIVPANGILALSTIQGPVGQFGIKGKIDPISAIEYANGQLYALVRTTTGGKIYTIDTTTPAISITANYTATLVGDLPTGFVINGDDFVYDAANSRFLVTAKDTPGTDALWQIPITNPAGASKIGSIGSTGLTGLSFENAQLTGFTNKADGTGNKISIDPTTGVGTLGQAISGITQISGATSIVTAPARTDFNGDGKSDILWRNDYGSVAVWQMDGATVTAGSLTSVPDIDPSWKVAGTGDFNGNGKADVLWRNDNGSIAVWTMDGATVTSSALTSTPSLDNGWKTAGTGDYNGDGKSDILWRNDNGSIAVWTMNGATVTSSALTSTPSLDASWKVAGNGDFNGDAKDDILWRNDDGSVALWQMNGTAVTASIALAKVSTDWKIAGTGDFTGDGQADILWRNDNGSIALWQRNGAASISSSLTSTPSLDPSWSVAGIGDYSGDGKADILWRNTSGAAAVWTMNGATVVASTLTSVAADSNSWKIAAPII